MTETIEQETLEQLRYPVGKFEWGKEYSASDIKAMIDKIETFPVQLQKLVKDMNSDQLNASYREGGWTVQQVIHHLFDSHMNAYMRFKLALTEDMPAIKPYNEKAWAELGDSKTTPPEVSVTLLINLHKRWVNLMRSMDISDFERRFLHPEHNNLFTLKEILAMYVWHGAHHYEHINTVKNKFKAEKKIRKPLLKKNRATKPASRKSVVKT